MRKLQPEDITRYQFLTSMKMSPAGKSAVLCASRINMTVNGYDSALWKLDTASEKLVQLTAINPKSWCYVDEETVLFTAPGTEEDRERVKRGELLTAIYSVPLAGGEEKLICRVPLRNAAIERLTYNRLLLSTFHDNRRPDFEAMPEEERKAALAEYAWENEWEVCTESPFRRDGKGMVDGKRTRLFVYDLESGELNPLTEPLKYYRNVTTPTMFVQTYEDYRCPLSEAVQMYTALQIRGVDTQLCMFHGESHSLSRMGRPRNRIRRLDAIMAWMDQYLKP